MTGSTTIKTIGLLGPFGFGNLGDAAIQEAVIHNIRRRIPDAVICGLSLNPEDTESRHGIRSFPIVRGRFGGSQSSRPDRCSTYQRLRCAALSLPLLTSPLHRLTTLWQEAVSIKDSYRILKGMDLLVFSGGGQLDDYWGGPWGHPYVLFKWAVTARVAGKRVVFMSVGVDSIKAPLSKLFIKHSLRLAHHRSYRDTKSLAVVKDLGITTSDRVYPDLAYSLPLDRRLRERTPTPGAALTIGVSPIAAAAWTEEDAPGYRNYLNQIVLLSSWLVHAGFRIVLFPSQIRADRPTVQHIVDSLASEGISDRKTIIANEVAGVSDLIDQISMCDLVIASRLHGVLLSHLMHRPVLAVSYNPKVDILMSEMGLSHYCINLNEMELNSAIDRLKSLQANLDRVVRQISARTAVYSGALEEQYNAVFGNVKDTRGLHTMGQDLQAV